MNKSRWMTVFAVGVVLAGLGMGALAYLSAPVTSVEASVLPDAAAWMPASASFVAYLDLASLAVSPLREEWESSPHRQRTLDELQEFSDKTGMNPWTDFRALAVSSQRTDGTHDWGLALTGDLAPDRIVSAIEEREKVERLTYGETTIFLFGTTEGKSEERHALAFPGSSTALFGPPHYVRTMLDVGAGLKASAVDGPLAVWLDELPLTATFWCVGSSEDAFQRLMAPKSGESIQIPPIESFAMSGHLEEDVSLKARARASDPESARKLADVVRGFVALGSLQQQSRPEIQAVLDSIQIGVQDTTVEVAVAVPFETIRRLVRPVGEAER